MSPNSRKLRVLPLALYAGASLAISTAAFAAVQPSPLDLTAYGTAPGGADLLAGRYGAAVEDLRSHRAAAFDRAAFNTNSCVAYAMTRQLRAAQIACAAAIDTAKAGGPSTSDESSTISANRRLAAAYSDEAVLHWISHDQSEALRDLAKAEALAPEAEFVARNKAALKLDPKQVQVHGS